jgi:hypothetical protein
MMVSFCTRHLQHSRPCVYGPSGNDQNLPFLEHGERVTIGTMCDLEKLRHTFRPQPIMTLFVGESPPHNGKFFYKGNSVLYYSMRESFKGSFGHVRRVPLERGPFAALDFGSAARLSDRLQGCWHSPRPNQVEGVSSALPDSVAGRTQDPAIDNWLRTPQCGPLRALPWPFPTAQD